MFESMSTGFFQGGLKAIAIILVGYFLFSYPKQCVKFFKYLLGKNENYKIYNLVLFIFPTLLVSFILSIIIFLYLSEGLNYRLNDFAIYGITASIPFSFVLLYLIKKYSLFDSLYKLIKLRTKKRTSNSPERFIKISDLSVNKYCDNCKIYVRDKNALFCSVCGKELIITPCGTDVSSKRSISFYPSKLILKIYSIYSAISFLIIVIIGTRVSQIFKYSNRYRGIRSRYIDEDSYISSSDISLNFDYLFILQQSLIWIVAVPFLIYVVYYLFVRFNKRNT